MIKQLSVFIENKIGSIAEVTTVLEEYDIDIKAIASLDTPEFAILRLIVNNTKLAKEVLVEKGYIVKMSDAIAVELEDKVGSLNKLLLDIADAGIATNYIYSFVIRDGKAPLIVFNTDEMDKTIDLLREKGYLILGLEDA